jgi:DNA invertase Pin-like site-specific DNA recombinase
MKAVAYYRVSTQAQGRSGLGLEAQKAAVDEFLRNRGAALVEEFTEVESGRRADRPKLAEALNLARLTKATLVIAKLDRMSRNAAFLLTLRDSGTDFVAVDMPDANPVTVGIMAVVAEEERRAISERTKAALAAARARGVKLGNPNGAAALRRAGWPGAAKARAAAQDNAKTRAEALRPVLEEIRTEGATSYSAISRELNRRHIMTPQGKAWRPYSVKLLTDRLR